MAALLTLAGMMLSANGATPQSPSVCAKVDTNPHDPHRYMPRKGRCEGLYSRDNSGGSHLVLLSLNEKTKSGSFGPPASGNMEILWSARPHGSAADLEFVLHGTSHAGGRHYQMDTRVPLARGRFEWPLDVLGAIGLKPERVYLLGYVRTPVETSRPREVYTPIRRGSLQGDLVSYDFTLEASADLNKLSYSIQKRAGDTWVSAKAKTAVPVAFAAAKAPFVVSVPASEMPAPGVYYQITFSSSLGDASAPFSANCIAVIFHG